MPFVALDGVAPVLSNLIFSNSNASYTILQGTGTTGLTLTGTGGSSPAAVTVISGTHTVAVPILLASNLDVSSSGRLTLSGNLSDGGLAKSLTLDGGGTLVLSGSDTYGGGTDVRTGTLYITNSNALPNGTNLTVAAGGTFIYDPSFTAAPAAVSTFAAAPYVPSSAAAVAAVPEPGSLLLLCAAAVVAADRRLAL